MGQPSAGVGDARRILITGLPGSGKSTVGRLVAAGIERSVHIDADLVRESIVGGFVHPDVGFADEFIEQIRLQREIVNLWAERMVTAGYTAVIDDAPIPPPPHLASHYAHVIDQASTIKVVLKPSTAALHERLTARGGRFDEMFLQILDRLHESIGTHDFSDWDVIDSTDQTPDVTAAAILDLL
jgi:adenylate kinase family enzyme